MAVLLSKKSTNAVNIIALVAVVGIALVAMAMVAVLSVFNGFEIFTRGQLSLLSPEYVISRTGGAFTPPATAEGASGARGTGGGTL